MKGTVQRTKDETTAVYRRHVDMVYRVCYMFLKNAPDTEDAVQSVFLKLIQSGPSFADQEHEKAWFIVTAQNLCKNTLKYWWRRKRSPYSGIAEQANAEKAPSGEILDMLLALPDKYKVTLYLFYYEGYSSREIAKLTSTKESTVRARLRNGRSLLERNLTGGDPHEENASEGCAGSFNSQ